MRRGMGSAEGALKAAATRTGLGVNEYIDRLNMGLLYCWRCQGWHAADEFGKDSTRPSGRAASCRRSIAAARGRKNPERPGKLERQARRAQGEAWCRGCRGWLPVDQVPGVSGACREHLAAEYRARYAASPASTRSRVNARKRGVEPLPLIGAEWLTDQFGGQCAYCPDAATTWDHVVPVVLGGGTEPGNVVPACRPCNSSKKNSDVDEWMARTGRTPHMALLDVMLLKEVA
jgi:5-methylcytosine-specific restriction endonuclease McrA